MNIDASIFNNPDFLLIVIFVFGMGLISWFMGWCISQITSIFIDITLRKE